MTLSTAAHRSQVDAGLSNDPRPDHKRYFIEKLGFSERLMERCLGEAHSDGDTAMLRWRQRSLADGFSKLTVQDCLQSVKHQKRRRQGTLFMREAYHQAILQIVSRRRLTSRRDTRIRRRHSR